MDIEEAGAGGGGTVIMIIDPTKSHEVLNTLLKKNIKPRKWNFSNHGYKMEQKY